MNTSNPVLNSRTFTSNVGVVTDDQVMTLGGTVNKSLVAILITLLAAAWTWNDPTLGRYYLPFIIGGFVTSLVLIFKKSWSPILVPIYALLEGAALGSISLLFNTAYPGVATQAVGLTVAVAVAMLFAYQSGWIRVSDKFRSCLIAATGGIALFYLVTFIAGFFTTAMNGLFMGNGMLSIGLSVVVTGVAALNLLLDFDFIANASSQRSLPKYMEWYGAFGLLVTLVWLYMEILRLLAKLNSRRD
jgi:uncharacterized YccA/Bax inhibitor family protein